MIKKIIELCNSIKAKYTRYEEYISPFGVLLSIISPLIFLIVLFPYMRENPILFSLYTSFCFFYLFIIVEYIEFSDQKACANLEELENKINENIKAGIFMIGLIGVIVVLQVLLPWITKVLIASVMSLFICAFGFFFSHIFSYFDLDLKAKVEVFMYISPSESILVMSFGVFLLFLFYVNNNFILHVLFQTSIEPTISWRIIFCVTVVIMAIINIHINTWRASKRLRLIFNSKTKELKGEKNSIVDAMKDISNSVLNGKCSEQQWRRNQVLKMRLENIENEIERTSEKYKLKSNYLSRIPILVAMLYALYEIIIKVLEMLAVK